MGRTVTAGVCIGPSGAVMGADALRRVAWWHAARDRVLALVDLGIANGELAPDLRRRVRIVSSSTLALFVVALPYIAHFVRLGLPHLVAALVATMLGAVANLWLLRATRRPQLCGHIGLGLLTFQLVVSNFSTGGFYDANFAWFYLLPIVAAVILDVRGAAAWTGLTLAVSIGFWALPEFGFDVANRIPIDARHTAALFNRTTAIIAIGLLAGSFVTGQRRAEHELAEANESLFRANAYSQLLEHAAVSANEATSFEEAMRDGVSRICTTMGWEVGHICRVSEGGEIEATGISYISDQERFGALLGSTAAARLRPGEGLPGRAVTTGQPVRVDDLDAVEIRDQTRVATSVGMKSAFAVPVFVNGKVQAVLQFGSTETLPNDERLLEVFAHIGVQLGRVAERTALQDRLRQSQKMEAVGQLAAGLAHEINNPMSYVRSNLNRLFEEWHAVRAALEKVEPPAALESIGMCEELIEECLEGIERTVTIVRDVQEFSHVDPERGEVDLRAVVDGALRVATSRAGPGIEFERAIEPVAGVVGSLNQLRQVVLNLVVNAIQAVGETGRIRVVASRDGNRAILRVEDDGPGIPADVQERLFEPFFTTKPVGTGTGLGLYVSYEIAKNHGGEITVESEPGSGTAFELRLPIAG